MSPRPSMTDQLHGWRRRLRALLHRRKAERETSAELAFHVDMETQHNLDAGMDPVSARRAALITFGGVDRFAEDVRDVRNIAWLEDLAQDVRHAARGFRRAPGFTAAAIAAIALGIGANTAVFSVVHAVVLAPLPFHEPERLVRVWESHPAQSAELGAVSPGTALDLRERGRTIEEIAVFGERAMLFSKGEGTWEARASAVSPQLFDMLGVRPAVGRTFSAADREAASSRTEDEVVIGYDVWKTRFGGDPGIEGRTLTMNYSWSYTIVGVMPQGFAFPSDVEIWTPLTYSSPVTEAERQFRYYGAVARLAPGHSIEQARGEAAMIAAQLAAEHPASNAGWTVRLAPLDESIVGDTRPALLILLALAGCVLLLACGNVATLAVARATSRRHETAVRVALGAGTRRLVRQWMAEGLLLALLGGFAGVIVGYWSSRALLALAPAGLPRLEEVAFGTPVLIFALIATIATGILVGAAPSLRAREGRVYDALRSRIAGASLASLRTREWLLGAQIALTFVLVVAAALLVRSFERLRSTDLGFRRHDVLSAELRVPSGRFSFPPWYRRVQYYDRMMEELGALPGVRSVAGTTNIPFTGEIGSGAMWRTDAPGAHGERPPTSAADQWKAVIQIVTPGYFATMGIPILRGRDFEAADRLAERDYASSEDPSPAGVAVINEAMAKRFWPDGDAIGTTLHLFDDRSFASQRTIVGVVRDARADSVHAAALPTIFLPFAQHPGRALSLVIRTELPPAELVTSVTERLRELDPAIAVTGVRPLDAVFDVALARPRFTMLLAGSFAVLALVIAGVGVFGIVGFLVARRTHEIGVRVALGALPRDVLRLVLGEGLRPVLLGVLAGGIGAVLVARAMRAVLYGVAPLDVPSFAASAAVLMIASMLAALMPARRAMGVDPLRSLRSE